MKPSFVVCVSVALIATALRAAELVRAPAGRSSRPQIAAYYFGNYHVDARNVQVHGHDWTEWELVKAARPRWPGHVQPNQPLWGYTDEADPAQMAQKLDAAADHGVDAFIFDWYYYQDGPYLQRTIDEGYLRAPNRDRVKFAFMWANHDWKDIHPKKLKETPAVLYLGAVNRSTFDTIAAHVVRDYFSVPSYWKIAGRPYFSIYHLPKLIEGMGGIEPTIAALRSFRAATKAARFPDLHINLVLWQRSLTWKTPEGASAEELVTPALVTRLGFDSITSYVWIHHMTVEPFPVMPYVDAMQKMLAYIHSVSGQYTQIPYYPNATMGWDASPRTVQSDKFENTGYPYMGTLGDNTPANFRRALEELKAWLETRPPGQRILTINAWNEWTEGSYLEPDTRHGLAYLEAIRTVFGVAGSSTSR